ncbi:putative integral membrane protein [Alloactinosynnema sp. L-07]|uniref:hypothetical protein n=1 Tax=Alloactinosynnema sp. L-07 TaxID=1653480 RepID=UPI00065F0AB8|nr:hypothetical protein [Alloactinosynnema sp. L-07]CRK56999.1 putative integral membrane protein [Alloactinosynnema sp. L-07]
MANHAPTTTRRLPLPWLAALVLVAVAAFALGRWVLPGEDHQGSGTDHTVGSSTASPSAGTLGAPHGPAKVVSGVPSGYTRDKAGAATAAGNAVQVQVAVAHGQADPGTVKSTWIASNATDQARAALSAGKNTDGEDQTNKLPVSTRITAFTDTSATVEVWVVAVGAATGVGGGTLTAARWSTVTFQLTWEGDWKVTTFKSVSGPQPGASTDGAALPALTNGLYTFYIE